MMLLRTLELSVQRDYLLRPRQGARPGNCRPFGSDDIGNSSVRASNSPYRMAATNSDLRQPFGYRVRHLPARQPAPSSSGVPR